MTARGRKPARGTRPLPDGAEPEQPSADAAPAAGSFVPLAGLAVAGPASSPERLRTGLRALAARPKLLVGAAADPAELEADALADAVVHRMEHPSPEGSAAEGSPPEGSPPATRVLGALRRTPASRPSPAAPGGGMGLAGGEVDTGTEQALRAASTAGRPLAPALRRQYENAFGADFGSVRVHSGPASAELNAALGARAFTLGQDIYFGDRVPGTASSQDKHLMAHELAHTLQDGDTGHRAVLRRLAVQITPCWDERVPDTEHPIGSDELSTDVEMPQGTEQDEVRAPAEAKVDGEQDVEMLGTGVAHTTTMPGTPVLNTAIPNTEDGKDPQPSASGEAALELFIEAVAIVGRPDRLFGGSMGDHMTAFVVSRKGVENAIVNQPFSVAVHELREMAGDLAKLPGWSLADALKPVEETGGPELDSEMKESATTGSVAVTSAPGPLVTGGTPSGTTTGGHSASSASALEEEEEEDAAVVGRRARASHHARLVAAKEELQVCGALLDTAGTDDLRIVRLQDYIAAYLELRELIPLSVADWKGANRSRGGKGDGESGLPGLLAEPGDQPPGQLRRDFVSSIATYRIAQAAVEPDDEALAVLMPGLDPALSADERTELMARQHVQSVLSNFPRNFGLLADDILMAEDVARARAERKAAAKASSRNGKASAKRKATSESDESKEEEEEEIVAPERSEGENFDIILNHLVRLVRMRYAEAAAAELEHQEKVAQLCAGTPQGDAALLYTTALSSYLAKGSGASSSPDSATPKRDRGSDTEVVDDVYGTLSKDEAKKVYTGRDIYQDRKQKSAASAELAVQVVLNEAGKVEDVVVERQGKYTKGAHTLPWKHWRDWLTRDIRDKLPDQALADFRTKTVPAVRNLLSGADTPEALGPSTPAVTGSVHSSATVVMEESKEEEEEPPSTMPLIELQAEIAAMLDEITENPDSAVLEATDTGGKGEAHYRVELAAFEKGQRELSAEQLHAYILALCDVGEADTDLAERTVRKVLRVAQKDYPKAYAASGIASKELADLADLASLGKAGAYESDAERDESESESEDEKSDRPKKRQKKQSPKAKRRSSTGNGKY